MEMLASTGDPLPPIVVHRATMRVIDGMHRLKAAKARGDREIAVEFFDGTEDDAFLRAVCENVVHGLPLSRIDREAAVRRIMSSHAGLSDRAIARMVALSPSTVAAIRRRSSDGSAQSNSRLGMDGRTRPVDAVEGRLRTSRLIAQRPDASLRAIARDAKVSLGTAHDVRKRMDRGEDPVPARLRSEPTGSAEPTDSSVLVPAPRAEGTIGGGLPSSSIVDSLRRDPALRVSETGRMLLQWLGVCALPQHREQVVDAIPEHCVESVLELASTCAENWMRLRQDLQRRVRRPAVVPAGG